MKVSMHAIAVGVMVPLLHCWHFIETVSYSFYLSIAIINFGTCLYFETYRF